MNKKIKIFALSTVILAGVEAKVMADKGCVYDCVSKFSKDVENCKDHYSNNPRAEQLTEECITVSYDNYKSCLKGCPITAPNPTPQN